EDSSVCQQCRLVACSFLFHVAGCREGASCGIVEFRTCELPVLTIRPAQDQNFSVLKKDCFLADTLGAHATSWSEPAGGGIIELRSCEENAVALHSPSDQDLAIR